MISGSAFRDLGAVIDDLRDRDLTIVDVRASERSLVDEGALTVEVTVSLQDLTVDSGVENVRVSPLSGSPAGDDATTTFEVTVDGGVDIAATEATDESDADAAGAVSDLAAAEAAEEDVTDESDAADAAAAAEDSTPYYENDDLLAEVYESHDTFAEMTEALGVDVTPATVREHMVNHGIHPTTDETEEDEETDDGDLDVDDDDTPSLSAEADGYGLPEGVSVESLVTAVKESRTLHEAGRSLGLDRSATRELLCDLDLLDMVTARLSRQHNTRPETDEIVERIHAASTA